MYSFSPKACDGLIVLDSTLEIAFKEYLVNESGKTYNDLQLLSIFNNRSAVHNEIKKYVKIKPATWKKIDHYYRLRCKLIHERVTVGIDDEQIQDFRELVPGGGVLGGELCCAMQFKRFIVGCLTTTC